MTDDLNPYPGNLKHHKVDAPARREPLLSDVDWKRMDLAYVRDFYEASRAKDAELIQRLVDELAMLQSVFASEAGYETRWGDDAIEAAAAAGFKPSEQ